MKYYIDIDNTICITEKSDYINSIPINYRINKLNQLKNDGNYIVLWTARGMSSNIDYTELTIKQLKEWNVNYDELLFNKPNYDIYIDDKSFNVNNFWYCDDNTDITKTKKINGEIVMKGWGYENIFINNDEYCGKILHFYKGKKFSLHYHLKKKETWLINSGKFVLTWIDTENGKTYNEILVKGDIITNERGEPHQMQALEESEILEVSTKHYDNDSYRICKGD